jgi:choline dehydrogenase-like flavoprotein
MLQSSGLGALGRMLSFRRAVGVFCKVADDDTGSVSADGRVSKTWTGRDLERREQGNRTAERILERAGCDPGDIHHGKVTLGHPCGTVRVGKLLDANLETPIEKLYCCDTSVLPEAPGIPPALTIVVLAKRLSRHLMEVT